MKARFTVVVMGGLLGAACHSGGGNDDFRPGRATYDTSAIDVGQFSESPQVRKRILYMAFGEAAGRLGSLRFDAEGTAVFSRGGEEVEQRDHYHVTQDPHGNFHVQLSTRHQSVEVYLVGEDLLVRRGHGRLRKKPRRQLETENWTDIAFAAMHQNLDLFRPRLLFVEPRPESINGRSAVRYAVTLGPEPAEDAPMVTPPPSNLPVSPPARWRELSRPLDLTGKLWLDSDTGVMLGLELEGRLEIADRDVRPSQLNVRYSGKIREIGLIDAITAPKAHAEFQRKKPPQDLLSFFRDHIPKPEDPTDSPTP